jgi:hypothetical protein
VADLLSAKPAEPIALGVEVREIAIVPDQAPLADFSVVGSRFRPGVPVRFDASRSKDPDGSIATYAWSFGHGRATTAKAAATTHTFARPGTYEVTLTLTDEEGCSTKFVFTGQTAYCNGLPRASETKTIRVTYPGVRLSCPRSARRGGCSFTLEVLMGKRAGASGHLKLKAGRSGVASLKPKRAFARKLAAATRVRVRITRRIGATTTTRVRKLRIVR